MKFIVISLFLFLLGCDELTDELFDCIDVDGPEFNISSLPLATLNEEYFVEIRASIDNEPNDSRYDYEFEFDGDLPDGLEFYIPEGDRLFQIGGTPTELGRFDFELKVWVSLPDSEYSYDQDDGLCYHFESEEYSLNVQM